jgi:S-adenosyl methyltransferase
LTCCNSHSSGNDHYAADRAATGAALEIWPDMAFTAQANRAFLRCAVRYLAAEAVEEWHPDPGTSDARKSSMWAAVGRKR